MRLIFLWVLCLSYPAFGFKPERMPSLQNRITQTSTLVFNGIDIPVHTYDDWQELNKALRSVKDRMLLRANSPAGPMIIIFPKLKTQKQPSEILSEIYTI